MTATIRYYIEYQPGASSNWYQSSHRLGGYATPEEARAVMGRLPAVTPRLGKALKYRVVKVTVTREAL